MKTTIKKYVEGDYKTMAPIVMRESGNVPPMLMLHFEEIMPEVCERIAQTHGKGEIPVANGFYIPIISQEMMNNYEDLMRLVAILAATFEHRKITKNLEAITISICGTAVRINNETNEQESSAEIFFTAGINKKGKESVKAQALKRRMVTNGFIAELVDSDDLEDEDTKDSPQNMLGTFFSKYDAAVKAIKDNEKAIEHLKTMEEDYKDNPVEFAIEMIDTVVAAASLPNRES